MVFCLNALLTSCVFLKLTLFQWNGTGTYLSDLFVGQGVPGSFLLYFFILIYCWPCRHTFILIIIRDLFVVICLWTPSAQLLHSGTIPDVANLVMCYFFLQPRIVITLFHPCVQPVRKSCSMTFVNTWWPDSLRPCVRLTLPLRHTSHRFGLCVLNGLGVVLHLPLTDQHIFLAISDVDPHWAPGSSWIRIRDSSLYSDPDQESPVRV